MHVVMRLALAVLASGCLSAPGRDRDGDAGVGGDAAAQGDAAPGFVCDELGRSELEHGDADTGWTSTPTSATVSVSYDGSAILLEADPTAAIAPSAAYYATAGKDALHRVTAKLSADQSVGTDESVLGRAGLRLDGGADTTLELAVQYDELVPFSDVPLCQIAATCVDYDPDDHAYFRIEELDDEVVFAVSADNETWTTVATTARPTRTQPATPVVFAESDTTSAPGSARLQLDQILWEDCAPD